MALNKCFVTNLDEFISVSRRAHLSEITFVQTAVWMRVAPNHKKSHEVWWHLAPTGHHLPSEGGNYFEAHPGRERNKKLS